MRWSILPMLMATAPIAIVGLAWAADDPSIPAPIRERAGVAMQEYLQTVSVGGLLRHYDPVAGELLDLKLEKLHAGLVKKGDFYVSCADFKDRKGRTVDVDLLALPMGEDLRVVQALVHAVSGQKRAYDLADGGDEARGGGAAESP